MGLGGNVASLSHGIAILACGLVLLHRRLHGWLNRGLIMGRVGRLRRWNRGCNTRLRVLGRRGVSGLGHKRCRNASTGKRLRENLVKQDISWL